MLKTFKIFVIVTFVLSFNSLIFAQKKIVHPIKPKDFDGLGITNDFKILAEGNQSLIDKPFVFVAREQKAYSQLQNLVEGLPGEIDFKNFAVVAGFAGERPTGGWSVEIRKSGNKMLVDVQSPRKDMMVTQMITSPFKVCLIPLDKNGGLPLEISTAYAKNFNIFQIKKGDFEFTGGIAGIRKKFKFNGTIKMLTFGENITFFYDLYGTGKDSKRKLNEFGSGTLKNEDLELISLDAGNFVDSPHPSFTVKGSLKNKKITQTFESLASNVADGYIGKGSLEAIQIK